MTKVDVPVYESLSGGRAILIPELHMTVTRVTEGWALADAVNNDHVRKTYEIERIDTEGDQVVRVMVRRARTWRKY